MSLTLHPGVFAGAIRRESSWHAFPSIDQKRADSTSRYVGVAVARCDGVLRHHFLGAEHSTDRQIAGSN
jgi:hypothetical protein